ncbi:MAG: hypothetical protein HGB36_04820 [Chlorobiaceae bacterium]|nr:hypothetical protein [Chlorobiaceae bacterium]
MLSSPLPADAICLLFGVFWSFRHLLLAFIKNYYHSNVAESGMIQSLNFAFILTPYVILMDWLYYKTNRSILIAIIFHITAGFFVELFAPHPDSKVIQTELLLFLSVAVIVKEKDFFFMRDYQQASP